MLSAKTNRKTAGSDAHKASDPVFFSKHFKIENVRGRRAVILGLSFAVIGGKRDQAHRFCFDVQKMLYKASVIVGHLNRGRPIAFSVSKRFMESPFSSCNLLFFVVQ